MINNNSAVLFFLFSDLIIALLLNAQFNCQSFKLTCKFKSSKTKLSKLDKPRSLGEDGFPF